MMARSLPQRQGLRFSHKDQMFEVNTCKLFLILIYVKSATVFFFALLVYNHLFNLHCTRLSITATKINKLLLVIEH